MYHPGSRTEKEIEMSKGTTESRKNRGKKGSDGGEKQKPSRVFPAESSAKKTASGRHDTLSDRQRYEV